MDVYVITRRHPIINFGQNSLIQGIRDFGHQNVFGLNNHKDLAKIISDQIHEGDIVILLGAGSITKWSDTLISDLDAIGGQKL